MATPEPHMSYRWEITRYVEEVVVDLRQSRTGRSPMPGYILPNLRLPMPPGLRNIGNKCPRQSRNMEAATSCAAALLRAREGDWQPRRLVVLEFPSVDQARR